MKTRYLLLPVFLLSFVASAATNEAGILKTKFAGHED